jgi:hypothetical protein
VSTALPPSTLEGLESPRQDRTGLWGRRAFLTVLFLVVFAGLLGFLGTRTTTATASGDGWTLRLEYASIARPGLDVPFTATVRHDGGLGEHVTLALTGDYLDIYETQGFHPDPSSTTRDGTTLLLTFDTPPEGDVFVVSYDAYIQPTSWRGREATLSVVSDGVRRATVHLDTHLFP